MYINVIFQIFNVLQFIKWCYFMYSLLPVMLYYTQFIYENKLTKLTCCLIVFVALLILSVIRMRSINISCYRHDLLFMFYGWTVLSICNSQNLHISTILSQIKNKISVKTLVTDDGRKVVMSRILFFSIFGSVAVYNLKICRK